jgi:serine/threonine protein kinase
LTTGYPKEETLAGQEVHKQNRFKKKKHIMFVNELMQSQQKQYDSIKSLDINTSPLHDHLTRISKDDLMNRYTVVEIIGHGSFGTISTVKLKEEKVGGSAFESQDNGFLGFPLGPRRKSFTPIADRPKISTNYLYALKEMNLDNCSDNFLDTLYTEISILRSLDHPNIVKALDVFETNKNGIQKQLCLVLELCTGGDLYARVPYSQREAALITSKVVNAISYIHQHNVIHRDIKFENILFESTEPDAEIKIIDFGLSKVIANHKHPIHMTERVGTM